MLKKQSVPLLEFDPAMEAVINPADTRKKHNLPEGTRGCVFSFMHEPVDALAQSGRAIPAAVVRGTTGDRNVYAIEEGGVPLALMVCEVGAPVAAGNMEELHAMGITHFISCGGAGVLDREVAMGHFLLPERALRDEGTSYHYQPPARFIQGDSMMLDAIEQILKDGGYSPLRVTTWTTDAFYRETRDKFALRKEEGCVCVEMECAAFMAVAKHRGIHYGSILYAADSLDGDQWDSRDWHKSDRRGLLVDLSLRCLSSILDGNG